MYATALESGRGLEGEVRREADNTTQGAGTIRGGQLRLRTSAAQHLRELLILTPVWGGHWPPGLREASRTRARSLRSLVHPGVDEPVQPAELAGPAGRQGGELLPRLNGFAPPLQHLRDIARREGTRSLLWWCLAMSWVTKV
jgi:hypothetical protein